jgi:hypothetical protein
MRQTDPHGHLFPPIQLSLRGIRSDLDLLATVPDAWLASHWRFEETGDLSRKLAQYRIPIDLLIYSVREVRDRRQYSQHVVSEAYRYGRELHAI